MNRANVGAPHRFPVRSALVAVGSVLAVSTSVAVAAADPTDVTTTPTPTFPRTTTPVPQEPATTTVEPPDYSGQLPLCPLANSWGASGTGISATVYEYGPSTVTIDVHAATGDESKSVNLAVGENGATITFDILPSSVRSVSVRAVGPGPLPNRCLLSRGD